MRMDEITTDEFRDIVKKGPVVILPLGAMEAHGPHLPLGTDTFQPEFVVDEISRIFGDKVLVAPMLPYGQHSTLKNIPGTIDLSFDTLRSVILDILDAFVRHGIRKILIISGHAGGAHMVAVSEACKVIAESHADVDIRFFSDFDLAGGCDAVKDLEGDGHGGMVETSRMLHIRPDLVRDTRPVGRYRSTGYRILHHVEEKMPDGMVGDTSKASADIGRTINEHIIKEITEMIS